MEIIEEKYVFNPKEPLGGLYEDAQIRNASYLATRISDDMQVQLVIYKSTKPGQIASYHKKISKFVQVKHPNLTPILECSSDLENNLLFIVLQWTQGYSLKEYLAGNVLHWKAAFSIIRDILAGLHEIHKEGLIYSYINLQNIQICEGRGRLSFRYLIYKTYYLSPEVKQNHHKSKESDLFSTGVCLFRIIFGTLPFKTKSSPQYTKSVKSGVTRKIPIENSNYPRIIPKQLQEYINILCHYMPAERSKYTQMQKKLGQMIRPSKSWISKQILGQNYILLSVQTNTEEYISASVIDLSKLKYKQQKRLFHLQMIKHNLTQISTYVDDIIIPFKNATNLHFANIREFYVVQKDCLVIIYDYCSQGTLKDFSNMTDFTKDMTEQVSNVLRSLLSQWRGQYRFLTNQQILINNGKPVLKYPPFPTKELRAKLKLSKKGNYFIAPQVQAGIQSITADSWSVGAIEYWLRFNAMPDFNDKGQIIISDKAQLTAQKCTQLVELLCKKHRQRKNLFPLQSKPADRKISSDSFSSNESPRLSSRIKSVPSANNAIKMTTILQPDVQQLQEEIDQFQIQSPKQGKIQNKTSKNMKKVQSRVDIMSKIRQKPDQTQQINLESFQINPSVKPSKGKQLRSKTRKRLQKQKIEKKQAIAMKQNSNTKRDSARQQITSHQLNLIQKVDSPPLTTNSKPPIKRFPTFSGAKDQKKLNNRDSIQKQRERQSSKHQKDSQYQKSQNSRRKTLQTTIGVQPMNLENGTLSELIKEGWRMSQIEKHWSKPIRIFGKGLIALLIYIFAFYFSFFKINGDLMKSRYDYDTTLLNLRSDSLSTSPTINFTAVTRTPFQTYNSLNNQTLIYIRDIQKCVTNDYNNNSNVYQIISSGSFGTYQAFGFIIVIINLILICFSLAKLDLPKALSMTQFDDHFYAPLYNWLLVNLSLTSLTSCTYLTYGGLFDLKLDPCLSRSSFPSLTYLMKNEPSSFVWRFIWVYIGIIIAYVLIIYLMIRPKVNMPRCLFIALVLLYLGGIGIRALGTYNSQLHSIFGACGELLSLFIGIPLLLIDLMTSCRLRKIQKSNKQYVSGEIGEEIEVTEENLQIQ